jgi:hypothetical protein
MNEEEDDEEKFTWRKVVACPSTSLSSAFSFVRKKKKLSFSRDTPFLSDSPLFLA